MEKWIQTNLIKVDRFEYYQPFPVSSRYVWIYDGYNVYEGFYVNNEWWVTNGDYSPPFKAKEIITHYRYKDTVPEAPGKEPKINDHLKQLEDILKLADHRIKHSAYGDNEAACKMSNLLKQIYKIAVKINVKDSRYNTTN